MTEVPEHLLQRSRERRAALGLGGGGGESGSEPAAAPEASTEVETSAPAAASPAPAAAPARPAPPAAPVKPVEPPYVAAERRQRIPAWAMPVIVLVPFWGFLYLGAFGERGPTGPVDPLVLGAEVYRAQCVACHGASGEGATGPALEGDSVEQTFPDEADHIAWVAGGSASVGTGSPYGDPARPGGQRMARGGMPPFEGVLSEEEIAAVVAYEREQL